MKGPPGADRFALKNRARADTTVVELNFKETNDADYRDRQT
jgi:hypothetical protein